MIPSTNQRHQFILRFNKISTSNIGLRHFDNQNQFTRPKKSGDSSVTNPLTGSISSVVTVVEQLPSAQLPTNKCSTCRKNVFFHAVMDKKRKMQLRCRDMEWWMKWRQLPLQLRLRVRHYERQRWAAVGGDDEMEIIRR